MRQLTGAHGRWPRGRARPLAPAPARSAGDEWFGCRNKFVNVHFRNIRGGKLDVMETSPDGGDMDMARSVAYRDVGYQPMLMPDHVPTSDGRDPSGTAFAFCYGYIRALLQTIGRPPIK